MNLDKVTHLWRFVQQLKINYRITLKATKAYRNDEFQQRCLFQ